jgi:hypothetical protein
MHTNIKVLATTHGLKLATKKIIHIHYYKHFFKSLFFWAPHEKFLTFQGQTRKKRDYGFKECF